MQFEPGKSIYARTHELNRLQAQVGYAIIGDLKLILTATEHSYILLIVNNTTGKSSVITSESELTIEKAIIRHGGNTVEWKFS